MRLRLVHNVAEQSNEAREPGRSAARRGDRRSAADSRRRARWELLSIVRELGEQIAEAAGSWQFCAFRRTACCGQPLDDVTVSYSPALDQAYISDGASSCGSVWSCPVCQARIRQRRTDEVKHLAKWHASNGGRLVMLTLTLSHSTLDSLVTLVEGLCDAWRRYQRSAEWGLIREHLEGQSRALEVTHGFLSDLSYGWHPHLHVLLLVKRGKLATVRSTLKGAGGVWSDAVVTELGERHRPKVEGSVGYHAVAIAGAAASYVTKIAQEMTRSDLKSGSRSPWSLLAAAGDGDMFAAERWAEYCEAMKGRRAVQWSRGLRAACGLDVDVPDDELPPVRVPDGFAVVVLDPRSWIRQLHRGTVASILESVEARCRGSGNVTSPAA